jgi:hypothetical protein
MDRGFLASNLMGAAVFWLFPMKRGDRATPLLFAWAI